MKPHILFDLDGTLTDSGPGIMNSVRYALTSLGRPVPEAAVLRGFVGPPLNEAFVNLGGLPESQVSDAIGHFRVYFAERGILENSVYPGIPSLLAALQAAGKKLHVATSKPEVLARQVLHNFNLAQYFNSVAGSPMDHAGLAKADVIRRVLASNALAAADAVMVGDRLHDILGARATGLLSIGVLYGYGSAAEMAAAGADYTAADPPMLRQLLLKE